MRSLKKIFVSVTLVGVVALSSLMVGCKDKDSVSKENVDKGAAQSEKASQDGKTATNALTANQKHRAEELTSVFENSTPTLDYSYGEDLGDGRGITCGRAGFCTGTGDAVMVVQKYTDLKADNILAKYLSALKDIENNRIKTGENQADTSTLKKVGDFIADWATAAKDQDFTKVQDVVVDELYYKPSAKKADELGLKFALSRAELYDTIIQHGNGDDPDALNALVSRTDKKSGGNPASGVDEKKWLNNFLDERRACLENPANKATKDEWSESVGRVDVFKDLVKEENYNLDKAITIKVEDWKGVVVP